MNSTFIYRSGYKNKHVYSGRQIFFYFRQILSPSLRMRAHAHTQRL